MHDHITKGFTMSSENKTNRPCIPWQNMERLMMDRGVKRKNLSKAIGNLLDWSSQQVYAYSSGRRPNPRQDMVEFWAQKFGVDVDELWRTDLLGGGGIGLDDEKGLLWKELERKNEDIDRLRDQNDELERKIADLEAELKNLRGQLSAPVAGRGGRSAKAS